MILFEYEIKYFTKFPAGDDAETATARGTLLYL